MRHGEVIVKLKVARGGIHELIEVVEVLDGVDDDGANKAADASEAFLYTIMTDILWQYTHKFKLSFNNVPLAVSPIRLQTSFRCYYLQNIFTKSQKIRESLCCYIN